jgi:putative DNA primase/helicase
MTSIRQPHLDPDAVERLRAIPIEFALHQVGLRLKKITTAELAGSCPCCGGRDRFSVNIRKNVFNCRGCGIGGDTVGLVMHATGVGFTGAAQILSGTSTATAAPARQTRNDRAAPAAPRSSDWWRTLWAATKPPIDTPAQAYLERRGLRRPYGSSLRFHHSVQSRGSDGKPRPPTSALVGLIRRWNEATGRTEATGVTFTFVQPDGAKAFPDDNRRFHGERADGGVWLILEPGLTVSALAEDELTVGEGLESTLSAMRLWSACAGVAALCAGGIETLVLPPAFRRVRIAADLDRNEAGQNAAVMAADRWRREGRLVRVSLPARQLPNDIDSFDFNDLLLRRNGAP